jgi:hypothetical protein
MSSRLSGTVQNVPLKAVSRLKPAGEIGRGGSWSLSLGQIVHAILQCRQLRFQCRALRLKAGDESFQFRDANIPLAASLAQRSIHAEIVDSNSLTIQLRPFRKKKVNGYKRVTILSHCGHARADSEQVVSKAEEGD